MYSLAGNSTNHPSTTKQQCGCNLLQNGVSYGLDMDSGNCCEREGFIILMVPVCDFKQPSRHVLFYFFYFDLCFKFFQSNNLNNNIFDLWKVKHIAGGIDSRRKGLENENLT